MRGWSDRRLRGIDLLVNVNSLAQTNQSAFEDLIWIHMSFKDSGWACAPCNSINNTTSLLCAKQNKTQWIQVRCLRVGSARNLLKSVCLARLRASTTGQTVMDTYRRVHWQTQAWIVSHVQMPASMAMLQWCPWGTVVELCTRLQQQTRGIQCL